MKWTGETASTENKERAESKLKRSWRHGWVKEKGQPRERAKEQGRISSRIVDTLDICFDLEAVPKHLSLYRKRHLSYMTTEKKKRLKKKDRWKVKIPKKERRPRLSYSFMRQENDAKKVSFYNLKAFKNIKKAMLVS